MVIPPLSISVSRRGDIMYALEESSFCIRLICSQNRPWLINLSAGPGQPGGARERALPAFTICMSRTVLCIAPTGATARCCPCSRRQQVPKPYSPQPLLPLSRRLQ
jgi:hypothetical protein